jgi:hypothetical protein
VKEKLLIEVPLEDDRNGSRLIGGYHSPDSLARVRELEAVARRSAEQFLPVETSAINTYIENHRERMMRVPVSSANQMPTEFRR